MLNSNSFRIWEYSRQFLPIFYHIWNAGIENGKGKFGLFFRMELGIKNSLVWKLNPTLTSVIHLNSHPTFIPIPTYQSHIVLRIGTIRTLRS